MEFNKWQYFGRGGKLHRDIELGCVLERALKSPMNLKIKRSVNLRKRSLLLLSVFLVLVTVSGTLALKSSRNPCIMEPLPDYPGSTIMEILFGLKLE